MCQTKKRKVLEERNGQIRAEFEKSYQGGLRSEVIAARLAEKFFLSQLTIEAIVFRKGPYKEF